MQKIFERSAVKIKISKILYKENLTEYNPSEKDIILVSNYHFLSPIRRDLEFVGFTGEIIAADEWMIALENLE